MIELNKFSLSYNGELIIYGLDLFGPAYEVKEKIPSGIIELKYKISIKKGKFSNQEEVYYRILPEYSLIRLGEQIISWGLPQKLELSPNLSEDLNFSHFLDQHSLKIVEDKRNKDVLFNVEIVGKYLAIHGGAPSFVYIDFGVFHLSFNWKLSQSEWLRLLSSLGYSEKWIIELDRPKLEGIHEVLEHINKAEDALYNKSDPANVLTELRVANESFKPFFEKHKDKISLKIDEGSTGQEGQKKKSDRVFDIYDRVSYFLNIGPHHDKYKVTYDDALLGYREFISILSYLSKIISDIKNEEEEKESGNG